MLEKEFYLSNLIAADLRDKLTTEQEAELNAWLEASVDNRNFYDNLRNDDQFRADLRRYRSTDRNSLWEKTVAKIKSDQVNSVPVKKISMHWARIAVAASVLIMIGFGVYFFKNGSSQKNNIYKSDVAPGINTAILTLGNGSKIALDSAANKQLAEQSGITISKTANGQLIYTLKKSSNTSPGSLSNRVYNTVETPMGGQYKVVLPDGTKVWLNAASSIRFPTSFLNLKSRNVQLKGEAYFEVFKDRKHPFMVASEGQQVEVMGTHFNVSAYENDAAIKTTLLEGLVRVSRTQGGMPHEKSEEAVLKPGQQSVLTNSGSVQVKNVDPEDAVAWKNGYFMFNNEELGSIMLKVSRWYNVKVVFEDNSLMTHTFFGTISRFEHVSKVLDMLGRTEVAVFEVKDNMIIVKKK